MAGDCLAGRMRWLERLAKSSKGERSTSWGRRSKTRAIGLAEASVAVGFSIKTLMLFNYYERRIATIYIMSIVFIMFCGDGVWNWRGGCERQVAMEEKTSFFNCSAGSVTTTLMSEQIPSSASSNTFERIKHVNSAGAEFWSGRELARVLEYSDFRNFAAVIAKASEACVNSGHPNSDHFVEITEMVGIGSGALRPVEDWRLSRYACYLVIQNADPSKPLVALGQSYFAVQTRRQEMADCGGFKRGQDKAAVAGGDEKTQQKPCWCG